MRRLLIFLATCVLAGSVVSCETAVEGLHSEYGTYYRGHDRFRYMPAVPTEYYIVFDGNMTREILAELDKREFEVMEGPVYGSYEDVFSNEYTVPSTFKSLAAVTIKGKGNTNKLPGVIYRNNLYYYFDNKIGRSMTFKVLYDIEDEDNQIRKIEQYAQMHNLIPLGKGDTDLPSFRLACTTKSSGNVLEMSNWFVEEGDFIHCEPDFMYEGADFEWYDSILFLFPEYCCCPGLYTQPTP